MPSVRFHNRILADAGYLHRASVRLIPSVYRGVTTDVHSQALISFAHAVTDAYCTPRETWEHPSVFRYLNVLSSGVSAPSCATIYTCRTTALGRTRFFFNLYIGTRTHRVVQLCEKKTPRTSAYISGVYDV